MTCKTLMVQGTSSSVGKSVIVTALCRIFRQDGFKVAPFKAQNMALNSFVTPDGGEIGRAQAVQSEAAGVPPSVDMNPILLKPEAEARSQVIVHGVPFKTLSAEDYYQRKARLWSAVQESFDRLSSQFDLIVIEGAGSPVEVNLKASDIVNMRMATYAGSPVVLIGDVDRGGVFASIIGTMELLEPDERELVKGFIINKFRGDLSLLKPGLDFLENRTGRRVVGVVPFFRDIWVAQEDSVYLDSRCSVEGRAQIDIAVLWLPHISNYDDFDPLEQEAGVRVRYVRDEDQLGHPDLIIIPGTKSTIADLTFLMEAGLGQNIVSLAREGTPVIGICGGYQILGKRIVDPEHVESSADWMPGLDLLPLSTTFEPTKTTRQVKGSVICDKGLFQGCLGVDVVGYEIHMGTTLVDGAESVFEVDGGSASSHLDGAVSDDGLIFGTYLHGVFDNAEFRRSLLLRISRRKGSELAFDSPVASREEQYDKLADLVRGSLDIDYLRTVIGLT
ncbi:MAG: cobyric acid synthase [Dehalococcoidales bacterium]|nr:cobyric acid synthase [Dehalococcoidales bacterium]